MLGFVASTQPTRSGYCFYLALHLFTSLNFDVLDGFLGLGNVGFLCLNPTYEIGLSHQ